MPPCSNTEAGPGVRVVCVMPPCKACLARKGGGGRFGQRRSERQSGAYVWTFERGFVPVGAVERGGSATCRAGGRVVARGELLAASSSYWWSVQPCINIAM